MVVVKMERDVFSMMSVPNMFMVKYVMPIWTTDLTNG